MIVEVQCLPSPPGTAAGQYAHIEAAITRIERAGIRYEVGALGTTLEGEPDVLWPLLREVHEACLDSGAASVVTVVKIAQAGAAGADMDIDSLTGPWR